MCAAAPCELQRVREARNQSRLPKDRARAVEAALTAAFLQGTDQDFERLLEATGATAGGVDAPHGSPGVNHPHPETGWANRLLLLLPPPSTRWVCTCACTHRELTPPLLPLPPAPPLWCFPLDIPVAGLPAGRRR